MWPRGVSDSSPDVLQSQGAFLVVHGNFRNIHFLKKELVKDTSLSGPVFSRGIPEPAMV